MKETDLGMGSSERKVAKRTDKGPVAGSLPIQNDQLQEVYKVFDGKKTSLRKRRNNYEKYEDVLKDIVNVCHRAVVAVEMNSALTTEDGRLGVRSRNLCFELWCRGWFGEREELPRGGPGDPSHCSGGRLRRPTSRKWPSKCVEWRELEVKKGGNGPADGGGEDGHGRRS